MAKYELHVIGEDDYYTGYDSLSSAREHAKILSKRKKARVDILKQSGGMIDKIMYSEKRKTKKNPRAISAKRPKQAARNSSVKKGWAVIAVYDHAGYKKNDIISRHGTYELAMRALNKKGYHSFCGVKMIEPDDHVTSIARKNPVARPVRLAKKPGFYVEYKGPSGRWETYGLFPLADSAKKVCMLLSEQNPKYAVRVMSQ